LWYFVATERTLRAYILCEPLDTVSDLIYHCIVFEREREPKEGAVVGQEAADRILGKNVQHRLFVVPVVPVPELVVDAAFLNHIRSQASNGQDVFFSVGNEKCGDYRRAHYGNREYPLAAHYKKRMTMR
jgi:hypothetical protein